tara:strand:- start:79 stop:921 length:843 start_codon:yes stop_codon:yes gene_type:complete
MNYKVTNNSKRDMSVVEELVEKFYPYAQESLRFDKPVDIFFESDIKNSHDPLGRTAFYEPDKMSITIFVDDRHPKDIMRSLSHELTHHAQNCAGHFDNSGPTEEGYAQKDPHLREMEKDAYLRGNLVFRDWENSFNIKETNKMKVNEETLRSIIQNALQQVFEEREANVEEEVTEETETETVEEATEADTTVEETTTDTEEVTEEVETEETEINEAQADEDPFACEPGEVYNENSEECEDAGAEEAPSPAGERTAQNENLDDWYRGTLYGKLLKEWTTKK